MNLPIPTLFAKKEKTEYFLSLLLREEKASAVILEEQEGKIHIIGKHEEYFSTSVEDVDLEEMLEVLDKTISKAEQTLPPNIETEKTVFGVKENWVEDKKIKKEYLLKLKKVSDELHLKPIGFLVISEAIAHLIQEEEGAPFTGIIAEVGKKSVTLTLFRASKIIETHVGTIDDTVPKTVDGLLKHFTSSDILPSRVIIFDGHRSEELAQEFISHQWSRALPFLHVPQVAVLPSNFDARAVVFGAAEQMGFEIIGSIVDKTAHEIKPLPTHGKKGDHPAQIANNDEDQDAADQEITESPTEDEKEDDFPTSGDNFGFVIGKDVAAGKPHEDLGKESDSDESLESDNPKSHMQHTSAPLESRRHSKEYVEPEEDEEQERDSSPQNSPLAGLSGIFGNMTSSISGIFSSLPKPGSLAGGNKLLLIPPVLIVIIIVLVILYVFQSKATVTLSLQPKMVDETENVTFAIDGSNNFEDKTIKAQSVTTTLSGSTTGEATGKKEVGEKAKGQVTLFNSDDAKKTLEAGTVIKSSNNIEFVLDKETVVSSASGDIFSGIKSGTTKADVTAAKIGTESNLPSNTKFTVAGNGSIAAKNDEAFSGGSKKNVTVVSKKDLEKLDAALPDSLKEKAKADMEKKISGDGILLPDFTAVKLTKKAYNKKEGEEAKEIKLTADVTFDAIAYNKDDLDEFAQALLKDRATSDQAIAKNTIEADAKDIKEDDDGKITASLSIKAGLLPKLDNNEIIDSVSGKSADDAESYLNGLPQVESSEIEYWPNIPLLPKLLPRTKSNITVHVKN